MMASLRQTKAQQMIMGTFANTQSPSSVQKSRKATPVVRAHAQRTTMGKASVGGDMTE